MPDAGLRRLQRLGLPCALQHHKETSLWIAARTVVADTLVQSGRKKSRVDDEQLATHLRDLSSPELSGRVFIHQPDWTGLRRRRRVRVDVKVTFGGPLVLVPQGWTIRHLIKGHLRHLAMHIASIVQGLARAVHDAEPRLLSAGSGKVRVNSHDFHLAGGSLAQNFAGIGLFADP